MRTDAIDRSPADLRLFGFALCTWGACAGSLWLPAATAWWTGTAVAGVLLVTLSTASRPWARRSYRPRHLRRTGVWAVSAGLLGLVCGCTVTAAHLAIRDADPVRALTGDRSVVRAEVTVTEDPRPLRATAPGPATYVVVGRLTSVRPASGPVVRLAAQVLVFATDPGWRGLLPSQRVVTAGRLGLPRGGDLTAAVLTASGVPELVGSPLWTQTGAGALRAGLRAASGGLPAEAGGLLPGLVLGDTSGMDPALTDDFRTTGLTHLTAVSGANVWHGWYSARHA